MSVHDTLVQHKLAVDIFSVYHLTTPVELIGMPLCTEGDEAGKRTEVVDVMVDWTDAERAQIGDDHGTVEGTYIQQGFGDPAKIVHHPQNGQRKSNQETGQAGDCVSDILGTVVLITRLDFVNFFVHLSINIQDGIRGLEDDLDCRFSGVDAESTFDGHDDFNIVPGVDAATGDKTVDPRHA